MASPRVVIPRVWALAQIAVILAALASIASERMTTPSGLICGLYLLARSMAYVAQRLTYAQQHHSRPTFPLPPEHYAIAVLLLMAALSTAITALPDITYPQVLRLLIGITTCLAIREGLMSWHIPYIGLHPAAVLGLTGLGLGLALIAPIGVDWLSDKLPIPLSIYKIFPRLLGDGIHANVMAGVLTVFLPIPFSQLLFSSSARPTNFGHLRLSAKTIQFGLSMATAIIFFILVITQSRGGLLGMAGSGIVLLFMRFRRLRIPILGATLVIALLLILRLALPNAGPPAVQQFLQSLLSVRASSSAELRYEAWQRAWYMIQDFPITGIGMGSYKVISDVMYPTFVSPESLPHAHNLFLQIAVDLGLPGLLAWLAAWVVVIRACIILRTGSQSSPALAAGLFASQVALGVHGLLDAPVWGQVRAAPLIWLVWGVALGLAYHQNHVIPVTPTSPTYNYSQ